MEILLHTQTNNQKDHQEYITPSQILELTLEIRQILIPVQFLLSDLASQNEDPKWCSRDSERARDAVEAARIIQDEKGTL